MMTPEPSGRMSAFGAVVTTLLVLQETHFSAKRSRSSSMIVLARDCYEYDFLIVSRDSLFNNPSLKSPARSLPFSLVREDWPVASSALGFVFCVF